MESRGPSSPSLSPEALGSYQALRAHADALAAFSASFGREAQAATAAYAAALMAGSQAEWRTFVGRCRSLADHASAVADIVAFNDGERDAWQFFAQIADENQDLVDRVVHAAA